MPRHPPCALHSLSHTPPTQPHTPGQAKSPTRKTAQDSTDSPNTCGGQAVHTTHYKDARVHYPDLKQQPHTNPGPHITCDRAPAGFLVPKPQTLGGLTTLIPRPASSPDSSEPQQCVPTPRFNEAGPHPRHRTTATPHRTPKDGVCR